MENVLWEKGLCRDVVLTIQGFEVQQNFHSFEIGTADVIFGITWLQSLGGISTIIKNW